MGDTAVGACVRRGWLDIHAPHDRYLDGVCADPTLASDLVDIVDHVGPTILLVAEAEGWPLRCRHVLENLCSYSNNPPRQEGFCASL